MCPTLTPIAVEIAGLICGGGAEMHRPSGRSLRTIDRSHYVDITVARPFESVDGSVETSDYINRFVKKKIPLSGEYGILE
ncbi:hypothetical protein CGCSCA4_v003457 [Colletotrichum siamense]|uniref:Uncharacterized protein n=1 Tax=Colletotrichum siamense TaxID=690259 RepID=A0A9P5EZN4_COLSI|nr:hypothetical protein CGCSCA4_v003457 [Colletotrichum siamense]KAF4863077.1 hypothetical protein CGCSCA2_v003325 [Colletotrichum siamense]